MANVRFPIQTLAGIGIVVALSLYGTFAFYDDQISRNKIQANAFQVGTEEQRFAALKHDLPADGMVGYVSDLNENGILLATQYALVPILIVKRPPGGMVVANFSLPQDYVAFGRSRGLALVKDYGQGAVLFREAKQ